MHPQAEKIQQALNAAGISARVVELEDSTRTAAEAASAVGCEVAQIVKSLVFKREPSGQAVLLLVSGSNRVDEKLVGRTLGEKITRADAEWVREVTGFAVGGIPPLGHRSPLEAWVDEDLLQYSSLWAAAGTPHAVFEIQPAALLQLTGNHTLAVHK